VCLQKIFGYIKTARLKERLAFVDGIPIEMNQKSYAAALQLIRLMEFDDSLAAAAEPFNWYHNLIHQMFDYEENNFNRSQLIKQLVNQPEQCSCLVDAHFKICICDGSSLDTVGTFRDLNLAIDCYVRHIFSLNEAGIHVEFLQSDQEKDDFICITSHVFS
jgi:hypothetical protein